ncbi:MAG: hypothetical protein IPO27_04125 [Bacteroidetes bacterium]|nr:hypothetical protein [Bacteroidota bacterium]
MKKHCAILLILLLQNFVTITIYAQGGTWTWISGDSIANAVGVYGTQGVPSVNNHPPAVYEPSQLKEPSLLNIFTNAS